MTLLLRSWHRTGLVLSALLLLASAASAQIVVRPLSADPSRAIYAPKATAKAQQRIAIVSLPFFDDFTTPREGAPRADLWMPGGGALVNNRYALVPLSRGAATLDGLNANGQNYSGSTTSYFTALDSLTSQPINLSGLQPSDSVYLSFAWQVGSIVGPPTPSTTNPVNLDLQFRSSTGRWLSAPGWPRRTSNTQKASPFRQVLVVINNAQYLYGSFQFRFVATGNASNDVDTWSIDYVRLDRQRTRVPNGGVVMDTTATDVATSAGLDTIHSGGLTSPLRRFSAMPVWQFNAATPANSELSSRVGVNVQNLNIPPLPIPIPWQGIVQDLNTGTTFGTWANTTTNATTAPSRITAFAGDASQVAIPATPAAKRLRYSILLNTSEGIPRTLANDTIFRDVDLTDYYAYDDGTPEGNADVYGVGTGPPRYLAYKFEANQPDQVRALRLYPIFNAADINPRSISINVWDDRNGKPADTARVTKAVLITSANAAATPYVELRFDTPVPVSGIFYVGFGQPSQGRILNYGYDLNSTPPANSTWFSSNGAWAPVTSTPRASLMMRAVMNNNAPLATATARESAAFSLYPNPSSGTVTVEGPTFVRATVLDALGRTAWEQPGSQAGQRQLVLNGLATGVYIVRLALPNGSIATRRLAIQ